MYQLSLNSLIAQVRTRIDELAATQSDMLSASSEDRNLDAMVENLAVEAIESVHLAAPAFLMEGKCIDYNTHKPAGISVSISSEGIMDISLSALTNPVKVLRVVSFQCGDSGVVCYVAHPQSGMWGKAQSNKYLRGTKAHPFLVECDDSTIGAAHFKYYTTTLRETSSVVPSNAFSMIYFPKAEKITPAGASPVPYYEISARLELPVVNYLTGLVLQAYGSNEAAQTFFTRATDTMNQ